MPDLKLLQYQNSSLCISKANSNFNCSWLYKIKKYFIWKNDNPKIKQDSLCKDYENGDLKNVEITCKIISLQCSWVKQLYDSSTNGWKLPLHIITQKLGKYFHFILT